MPVIAVTLGGMPTVICGSSSATRANMCSLTMPFLTLFLVSERTQMEVISLPVPAVVGMRISGTPGFGTSSMPKYFSIGPSLVSSTEVTLEMSSELPPPRPMITSGP